MTEEPIVVNATLGHTDLEEKCRVEALQAGSEEAFNWLIAQYASSVFRLAYRILNDHADAADAVQEVFLKVFRNIGEFQGDSSLKTWIYRISVNTASNQNRWWRRHKEQEFSLDAPKPGENEPSFAPVDRAQNPCESLLSRETQELVRNAMSRLPESFRTVLVLREMEELSYEEMAAILHLSLGTVKSRLARARHALKSELESTLEVVPSRVPVWTGRIGVCMLDRRNYRQIFMAWAENHPAAGPLLARFAKTWRGWTSPRRDDVEDNSLEAAGICLKEMPVPAMPSNLRARIHSRVRQERTKVAPVAWTWKLKNRLEPLAIPSAVGLLSALFIFGIFVRIFEVPVVHAGNDVPLTLRTAPRLRTTALMEADTGIKSMQVALVVDEDGRVADYKIIQGTPTPEQLRLLQYLLVFTVFEPATLFGRPTTETVTFALRDGYLRNMSL